MGTTGMDIEGGSRGEGQTKTSEEGERTGEQWNQQEASFGAARVPKGVASASHEAQSSKNSMPSGMSKP